MSRREVAEVADQQRALCQRLNTDFVPSLPHMKAGVSDNVRSGTMPINGLRHPPTKDTSGWYIWAGEVLSDAPDFFLPLHLEHISEWCPFIEKFLGLPPGWRFLAAEGYEDAWFDETLLKI